MTKNTSKTWKFLKFNGKINRKYKVSSNGDIVLAKNMTPLKQHNMAKKSPKNGTDYKSVYIPGICDSARVHRVVCETFHGKPSVDRYLVNHIDEHKDNNTVTNLKWVSASENMLAYYKNNAYTRHPLAKIVKVKKLLNKGWTNDRIAQEVSMSDSNVSLINFGDIHTKVVPHTVTQKILAN